MQRLFSPAFGFSFNGIKGQISIPQSQTAKRPMPGFLAGLVFSRVFAGHFLRRGFDDAECKGSAAAFMVQRLDPFLPFRIS